MKEREYVRVVVNGTLIRGPDVKGVMEPSREDPIWVIKMADGSTILTTGNVSVEYKSQEGTHEGKTETRKEREVGAGREQEDEKRQNGRSADSGRDDKP